MPSLTLLLNTGDALTLYKSGQESEVKIAVTIERVEQGWIAFAPEARATAQGDSQKEAVENLLSLFQTYPDLLTEVRQAQQRNVELVTV